MQLHPDAEARGVRLIAHETLGSTNAEALTRARAGERGPLWVTAARQTAGRGRRGNVWTSEPGNLYASLLLTDAAPAAHLPRTVLRGGAGVLDAVSFGRSGTRRRRSSSNGQTICCSTAQSSPES